MGVFKRRELSGGSSDSLSREPHSVGEHQEDNSNNAKSKKSFLKRNKSKSTNIDKEQKKSSGKYLPQHIYIGYRPSSEVKKKELVDYIKGKANEKVTPIENAYYHIEKFGDGHFWEIHDGGSGHSILPHIIENLEDKDDFSFVLNNDIFVIKKVSQGDTYGFNLVKTKADNIPALRDNSQKPHQSKKMKVFVKSGFGLFVFSLIMLLFSSILLVGSFYVRDDRKHDATIEDLYSNTSKLPISKYKEIAGYMNNEKLGLYVETLKYSSKKNDYEIKSAPTIGYDAFKNDVLRSLGKDIVESTPPPVAGKSKADLLSKEGK